MMTSRVGGHSFVDDDGDGFDLTFLDALLVGAVGEWLLVLGVPIVWAIGGRRGLAAAACGDEQECGNGQDDAAHGPPFGGAELRAATVAVAHGARAIVAGT